MDIDVSNKNFLVTGANSGLGKEIALGIAKRGGRVHMICRNQQRGEESKKEIMEISKNSNIFLHVVDVSSPSSIVEFAENWAKGGEPIHVLVNNAGVLLNEREFTKENLEVTFATNILGCFIMTNLLMPFLSSSGTKEEPSRVLMMSSGGMYTKKNGFD